LLWAVNIQGIRLPGKITTITGKAQIGVTVTLSSSLSIQCLSFIFLQVLHYLTNIHIIIAQRGTHRATLNERRKQRYNFILENISILAQPSFQPSNTCVPSTIGVPSKSVEPEPIKLSGNKIEMEEEIDSDWIPPYRIKLKKIKIDDPRGNFW
jgi:hypothetical protein